MPEMASGRQMRDGSPRCVGIKPGEIKGASPFKMGRGKRLTSEGSVTRFPGEAAQTCMNTRRPTRGHRRHPPVRRGARGGTMQQACPDPPPHWRAGRNAGLPLATQSGLDFQLCKHRSQSLGIGGIRDGGKVSFKLLDGFPDPVFLQRQSSQMDMGAC
jgi:hypothetical protein